MAASCWSVASAGSKSILMPLNNFYAGSAPSHSQQNDQHLPFKLIKGLGGLEAALQSASQQNKPVMVDMYADWCISCKELEAYTFTDPNVHRALDDFILLKADVTANDELDQQLLKKLGIFGPPALLFFDASGKEQRQFPHCGLYRSRQF